MAAGHQSEIFAGAVDSRWAAKGARHYQEYGRAVPARSDDRLVYQVAIGSPVADWLIDRSETLIANHHNFTPMRFLQAWDPAAHTGSCGGASSCSEWLAGRRSASPTRGSTSSISMEAGFAESVVVPVFIDLASSDHVSRGTAATIASPRRATAAATGCSSAASRPTRPARPRRMARGAPRAYGVAATRLHLVGGSTSPAYYVRTASGSSPSSGVDDAVEITGPVSAAALARLLPGCRRARVRERARGFLRAGDRGDAP